jgi:competence protein ComEC
VFRGFGLSVAATAGIIWLSPLIEARLGRLRPFWRNTIATTLAAQISVAPLLLYSIGLFSLVALPANLLVNPLMPLAMAGAAIAGVAGMTVGSFIPLIATLIGYPTLLLTRYFIFIAACS